MWGIKSSQLHSLSRASLVCLLDNKFLLGLEGANNVVRPFSFSQKPQSSHRRASMTKTEICTLCHHSKTNGVHSNGEANNASRNRILEKSATGAARATSKSAHSYILYNVSMHACSLNFDLAATYGSQLVQLLQPRSLTFGEEHPKPMRRKPKCLVLR